MALSMPRCMSFEARTERRYDNSRPDVRHFGTGQFGCRCTPSWVCDECGVLNESKRVTCKVAECSGRSPPRYRETPAHFVCGCIKTKPQRDRMYEQLVQVKGIKRSAVERMRGESEETQSGGDHEDHLQLPQ